MGPLAAEAKKFTGGLPVTRTRKTPEPHMTASNPALLPAKEGLFTSERSKSYAKESGSWLEAAAKNRFDKSQVPGSANIVGSHVLYKRKSDGTPTARIVPWGYRHIEKMMFVVMPSR